MDELAKAKNNLLFKSGIKSMAIERDEAALLCYQFNQLPPNETEKKDELMRQLIGNIKGSYKINAPFHCDYGKYITLGDHFFANYNCMILDGAQVTFGDDVRIGPNCVFATPSHAFDPEERREGYEILLPITVGNNVWFGASVTVLPGVTIGDNSIIAAGSIVSRDIGPNVIAAGNPCKAIREITQEDRNKYPR